MFVVSSSSQFHSIPSSPISFFFFFSFRPIEMRFGKCWNGAADGSVPLHNTRQLPIQTITPHTLRSKMQTKSRNNQSGLDRMNKRTCEEHDSCNPPISSPFSSRDYITSLPFLAYHAWLFLWFFSYLLTRSHLIISLAPYSSSSPYSQSIPRKRLLLT